VTMPANNSQLIADFVAYLRIERGAKENTLTNYEHDVTVFSDWLRKPFASALRADLQCFIADSLQSGISGRTVGRRVSCLRHFFRFLIEEEEIKTNPTRNLPVPKSWKTVPRSLGLADLEKMVAHPGISRLRNPAARIWLENRDKAMLLTFFASGLRESELAALRLEDLDFEAGAAKVWDGKGGKDGLVLLSPPAIAALRCYLETAPPFQVRSTSHVFLNRWGRGPLTRMAIYYRVRAIAQAALGRRISPHVLRHSFATALVEGGADIRDVQILMRHSSVDTTAIYIHTDLSQLRRTYASHPRARFPKAG
jgi:integrase/recombinase XerD